MSVKTPILFLIFNRPDTTKQVFKQIREAKPSHLFIAADGPREDKHEEKEKCEETRKIVENIDWACDVKRLYRKENLGCKLAVSSAIDWFFENVEEGIILEDDCFPDLSFFTFCEKLLERYRTEEKVMMISGTNLLGTWKPEIQSYHFSYFGGIWGWATWKRAWSYYDPQMKKWGNSQIRESIKKLIPKEQYSSREYHFEKTYQGEIDTWDYQWSFTRLSHAGLSIIPSKNLIANIGFRSDATHTKDVGPWYNPTVYSVDFPLKKIPIAEDKEYNNALFNLTIDKPGILRKIYNKLKNA